MQNSPWVEQAIQEAWTEARKIVQQRRKAHELAKYADDPVGFCETTFGEFYTEDVKRVMLSVRDNPITVAKSGNSVGKTHGSARIALWFYLVYEDAKIYLTAAPPLENLRRLLWGEIVTACRKRPDLVEGHRWRTMSISRTPVGNQLESFITGVAIPTSGTREDRIAKFSGKHSPHLLFIVDEGDAVPDEIYEGIESCMSGGMARLLIMFNPKAQYGNVYQMERDRKANVVHLSALDHPNVVTGETIIPGGAVDRETTVRRINEWTRPLIEGEKNTTPDIFTPPDYLIGTTAIAQNGEPYPPLPPVPRKIEENAFYYMVLGEYPAQSEMQLISSAWIDVCRDRWDNYVALHGEIPPTENPITALDVAELGGDYNVLCHRYGGFVPRFTLWSGIDTDMTATKTIEHCRKISPNVIFVDAIGTGSSVAPSIARQTRNGRTSELRAFSIKFSNKPTPGAKTEFGEFYQLRDQLWWMMREWLRQDPTAMIPPDPFLVQDLKAMTYRVTNGKIKMETKDVLRKVLRRSPDRGDALALTFMPIPRATVLRLGG